MSLVFGHKQEMAGINIKAQQDAGFKFCLQENDVWLTSAVPVNLLHHETNLCNRRYTWRP